MTSTPKKKGPASVGALPDRGSNLPPKGMIMNGNSRNTAKTEIPEFPLFAMAQGPGDDLAHASSILRVVSYLMEDGVSRGIDKATLADLQALLCDAMQIIRPILLFLDEIDDTQPLYRECRRRVIVERAARIVS